MKAFIQITPEQIIDLNAVVTAHYHPSEDPHSKNTLQLVFSNGTSERFFGETAYKIWKLIQERATFMEAF